MTALRLVGPIVALALFAGVAAAQERIKVLIVDGQNNHQWQLITPPMKRWLEQSGRFAVEVATSPAKKAPKDQWEKFRPDFSKYNVVLSNYNGDLWPEPVQKGLEKFVADGGGLSIIHAANNAFPQWAEWNKMIGLGWRGPTFGERVTVDDSGKVVRTPKGQGPGAGHGPPHAFPVMVRDKDHPITKGMPETWMHARDELYHGQRGPAENMHILATAFSAEDKKGTRTHEPMVWVIPYGKGRVFTTVMGHVMGGDTTALRCVGFITVMLRGTEWAATGNVTIPIPPNFPSKDIVLVEEGK
jgi:hypothetical protein